MPIEETALRLFVAFICGCVIGSERQFHHRTAGLKTASLVALGACAFTIFDLMNHMQYGSDLRVSAQVVSGIGFLGGGAILKDGFNIRGLTTAATLWCSAAAGLLSGMDYIWEAVLISAFVMIINTFLRPLATMLENGTNGNEEYLVKVTCDNGAVGGVKQLVLKDIEAKKLTLKDIKISKGNTQKQGTTMDVVILSKKAKNIENISHKIAKDSDINSIMWEIIKG